MYRLALNSEPIAKKNSYPNIDKRFLPKASAFGGGSKDSPASAKVLFRKSLAIQENSIFIRKRLFLMVQLLIVNIFSDDTNFIITYRSCEVLVCPVQPIHS